MGRRHPHFLLRLQCPHVLRHGGACHAADVPRTGLDVGNFKATARLCLRAVLEPRNAPVGTSERGLWALSSAQLRSGSVPRHKFPLCAGAEWDEVFGAEIRVGIAWECAIGCKMPL